MSFRNNCISKYLLSDDELLLEISSTGVDGCDCDGPDAYVYNLCLYFKRNMKIYEQHFYGEYRVGCRENCEDDDVVLSKREITNDEFQDILKKSVEKENQRNLNRRNITLHSDD